MVADGRFVRVFGGGVALGFQFGWWLVVLVIDWLVSVLWTDSGWLEPCGIGLMSSVLLVCWF